MIIFKPIQPTPVKKLNKHFFLNKNTYSFEKHYFNFKKENFNIYHRNVEIANFCGKSSKMQIKPERFVKAALLLTFPSFCIAVVEKCRKIPVND